MSIKYLLIFIVVIVILFIFMYLSNYLTDTFDSQIVGSKADLTHSKAEVDYYLNDYIDSFKDPKIRELNKYVLENGKRVRSIIMLSIFKKLNGTQTMNKGIIHAIISIELIQSASLIIDDIMDDDKTRRDKECLHVKHGNTMAQLIAIQLTSNAFKNLCSSIRELSQNNIINKNLPVIFFSFISENLDDLVIGQYKDIDMQKDIKSVGNNIKNLLKKSNVDIEEVIHQKTSSLFIISFVLPWLLSNPNLTDNALKTGISKLTHIAKNFGLLFQIADDFEDVEQDLRRDGKNVAMNYVICRGETKAYSRYQNLVNNFVLESNKIGIYNSELEAIITYLNNKVEQNRKTL